MVIFKYEWRQLRKYTFWWSVICAVSIFAMFPVYLQMISTGAAGLGQMTDNPVFELFGVDPAIITQPIGVFGFLSSFFSIAAGINGMFLGLKTFTKETIGRSAEFLYTKPYKRGVIFHAKVGAAAVSAFVIGISYYVGAMASGYMNVSGGFDFRLFSLIALSFLFVTLFFLLLGALVGAVYPKIRTPLLLSSGVVFVFFVLASFAGKVNADVIKFITPFSWFGANVVVKDGGYNAGYMTAFVVLCVSFSLASYFAFVKKDTTLIS